MNNFKRLTARSLKNGTAYLAGVKENEQDVESKYPNTLRCILDCFERLAVYEEAVPEMYEALKKALQFINNGRKFGYIQMPDADCGDTALETPNIIRRALAKAEGLEDKA